MLHCDWRKPTYGAKQYTKLIKINDLILIQWGTPYFIISETINLGLLRCGQESTFEI